MALLDDDVGDRPRGGRFDRRCRRRGDPDGDPDGDQGGGMVIDDAAVMPSYVTGFNPDRELQIIAKITGSATPWSRRWGS